MAGLSLGRRMAVTPIAEEELLAADPTTAFTVDPNYIGEELALPRRVALRPRLGEAPPAAPKTYSPGFLETLDAVLGGETITGARKRMRAEHQAQAQEAALMEAAAALFADDPQALLLFQANPKALTDALSERYKPLEVTEGNTVVSAGEKPYTAPKQVVDGGHVLSVTPAGARYLGQRPMSHDEETDRSLGTAEHLRQKLKDARDYELESKRVGIAQDGLRHRLANAKAGGGSSGSGGGGGGRLGQSLGKPWERSW